jgi:hypothetical protein
MKRVTAKELGLVMKDVSATETIIGNGIRGIIMPPTRGGLVAV